MSEKQSKRAATKGKTARALTDAERQGLLSRAEYARAVLDHAIAALREPDADAAWTREWIDGAFHKLFKQHGAYPWLSFVRCIDHAARTSLANPHFTDRERVEIARDLFRRTHADLDERLVAAKVEAAITAWRTRNKHWEAIHNAALDFNDNAPAPRNMSRQWQDFAHLPPPTMSQIRGK